MKLQFLRKENHGHYYSLVYQTEPMTLTTSYQEPETHNAFMQPVPGKRVVEKHSCSSIRADFSTAGGNMTNLFFITDAGLTLTPNDLDISEKQKQKIWGDFLDGVEALRREHGPQTGVAKWKSVSEPPKKNGRYLVEFYFKNRHETDRTEMAYRDFTDGIWTPPYFSHANEGSELIAWFDIE